MTLFPFDRSVRPPYTGAEILAMIDSRTDRIPAEPTTIVTETVVFGDATVRGGGDVDRSSLLGATNKVKIDTSSGTATTYGSVVGLVNGSNTVYTNETGSYVAGTTEVYWETQKQTLGVDYTESDPSTGEITFTTAPLSATNITWAYLTTDESPIIIFMTTASGTDIPIFIVAIGGGQTTFTLTPYITAALRVYLNGALQVQGSSEDWVEVSPSAGTAKINREILVTDIVEVLLEPALDGMQYENTNDTLSYTFNGSNKRGTTTDAYKHGTLYLSWNGLLLTPGSDYIETEPESGTFDTVVPYPSGVLAVVYYADDNQPERGERTISLDKSAAHTMTVYDRSVNADASGGAFTITLPAVADTAGMEFNIIKVDSSANGVTIGGTVNGVANPIIRNQFDSFTMRSNGTGYFLV